RARLVLDDDRPVRITLQTLGDQSQDRVRGITGGKRIDDLEWLTLRRAARRREREGRCAKEEGPPRELVHGILPFTGRQIGAAGRCSLPGSIVGRSGL